MAQPTQDRDWPDETPAQGARRKSAEKTGRWGLANDALAESLGGTSTINNSLRSQSLTRRMDQARYAAQQARVATRRRGSR